MKTEFNVERVCERVHLCIVDTPDEVGEPLIEIRAGSIHISFPGLEWHFGPSKERINAAVAESNAQNAPEAGAIAKPKRRGK